MNPNSETINAIIEAEWPMFSSINADGQKAPCQGDKETFSGMRRGQFAAWSDEAVRSYWNDIQKAQAEQRNLILEKYVFMMKSTLPAQYEKVAHLVTEPVGERLALIEEITEKLVGQTVALFAVYPCVAGTGRPVHSTEDDLCNTSIETYQRGELCTYSEETLRALKKHLDELESQGIRLSEEILKNTVRFYGYDSLEAAEKATAKRMEAGIQIGYKRCPACS